MKSPLFFLLTCICFYSQAQMNATTDQGKKVILNPNGTWMYDTLSTVAADTSLPVYKKPATATLCLKSKKVSYDFYYDPKIWRVTDPINESAEFSLLHKNSDAFAMIITERLGFGIEDLKSFVIERFERAGENMEVVTDDKRIVNGLEVTHLKVTGKVMGLQVMYDGYYITSEEGSVQLVCFTGKNLYKEFEKDIKNLLNGLTKRKLAATSDTQR